MEKSRIVRAWRDREFYESLTEAEKVQVPANPAGVIDVGDDVLDAISGGICDPGPPFPDGYTCSGFTVICTPCPPRQCY